MSGILFDRICSMILVQRKQGQEEDLRFKRLVKFRRIQKLEFFYGKFRTYPYECTRIIKK